MYRSAYQMSVAASQVRGAASSMSAIVAELQAANVWTGNDVNRFVSDWYDQVTAPLHRAASQIDGIEFKEPES